MSWCVVTGTHADNGVFIICNLVEVAKTTHENVIGAGGTVTAIIQALGHEGKFGSLKPRFLGGSLDITTLTHMTIIDTKRGTNKYSRHKQFLFTFLEVAAPPFQTSETGIMIE